jgi:hypothetical protein
VADEAERPRIYAEPPIPTTTEFNSVDQVRAVINQHDTGRFRMSALLMERMLWNPRLRATVNTRLAGLLAAEVKFDPARENRDARRAAREFAEDWPAMVTAPVRKQYRKIALMLGVAFGQRALQLSPSSGRQIFRLRPYWPGFASWYWAEGGYRIQTFDAGVVDAASPGIRDVGAPSPTMTGLINPSEQPWVIDEPNGENSWREGLLHAAWRPWLGHEWAQRDQARNSEKNGIGVVKAKYPRGQGEEHEAAVRAFTDGLRGVGSEGVYPLEQRGEGEASFDVEPFEFNGTGNQAIGDTLNANAVALAILLLGHNLTTEIKGGGSYAAAGIGEYIRDDIKHDDAACEWAVFGPQLARPYCLLNYGDPELAPRARYITDSTAVNRAIAQMYASIAQAIQFFRMNVPAFDVDAFCEQWRIPLLPAGAVQVPPTMPAPAAPSDDEDESDTEEMAA